MLENFFFYHDTPLAGIEEGVYRLPLVVMSYLVAAFASYAALSMAQQLTVALTRRERHLLHWGGAFALGAGIWSMHFIGMLSYHMAMALDYDPYITFLSMVIAIGFAYGVLSIVGRGSLSFPQLIVGAILLGIGISAMHYTGMAAMEMDADLRYRPVIFFLSVAIAIVASGAALWMAFTLTKMKPGHHPYLLRIGAALIMGAAICGMHYTGMGAAVFLPYADCRYDPNQDFTLLALSIAAITAIILGMAVAGGVYRATQVEFRLQGSERKIKALIDSAPDALAAMDGAGRVMEWNAQAERLFGWSAREAFGHPFLDLVFPPEQRMLISSLPDFLKGESSRRMEIEAHHRSGKTFPAEMTVAAYRLHGADNYAAFIRDLTDREQSGKVQALLAAIVSSTDDAIISRDLAGIVTSWNTAAEHMYGYKAEETLGRDISFLIPPDRREEEQALFEKLKSGERFDHFETVRRAKDGRLLDVSITISPIRNAEGEIIGASKVARDITERKKSEEALKKMSRKKDEFLANMSHELRTPMNAVVGLSNLLGLTEPLTEKQRKFIETLKLSADNLLQLINDLLDFSKLEQHQVEFEHIEFCLYDVMEKIISPMHLKAKEKGLDLRVTYPSPLRNCYFGDPLRVSQIITNLVGNALKFTEEGGVEVTVSGKESDDQARSLITIEVSDTGIGIPADKIGTVFEKFSQADASITRKYGGSGLGLAITKTLAEKMGGTLSVESEVGAGSTFTVTIPLRNSDRLSTIVSNEGKELTRVKGAGKVVLLVEDYEPNVLVVSSLLEKIGYGYEVARNGLEALRKFQDGSYDAILMDVQMPVMDGLETTRRMRAIEREKGRFRTPIIAMTAHVRETNRRECKEAGMDDFIPKPFDINDFLQKLQRLTDKPPGTGTA